MDIIGIILLINCILIAVMSTYIAITSESIGEGLEPNTEDVRNKKGVVGWFFVSALVGMFALPLMILREVYQWKRYKLPRFEWDDICRYGFTIILGSMLHMLLLVTTSCSSPKPIIQERVVLKTDTLDKTSYKTDTFRLHDSIYVENYIVGDTVYKNKNTYKWRDRVSIKTDTIYKTILRTDSISVPIPVEHKATWWERTLIRIGRLTIGAAVLFVISLLLWLIHRKK